MNINEIIESVSRLSPMDQGMVLDAMFSCDNKESKHSIEAAWELEIKQRLASVTGGDITTIPAEKAEGMIRRGGQPLV